MGVLFPTPRRRCTIRLATASLLFLALSTPIASGDPVGISARNPHPASCSKTYSRSMFHAAARSATRDTRLTFHELEVVRRIIRCQGSARSRRIVKFHWRRYKRHWHLRRSAAAVTPYPGPNGTRWAIPWAIVSCESHGQWGAANPSGAIGPYQLLGWGAPWPANTAWARWQHHLIAARVWAGGAGRSNWVC